jgi:dipeptidase E
VPALVEGGLLVYVGTSAGAILAGPDVEPAASPEGRREAPALDSTAALQLVPFSVLPHDQDPERRTLNASVLEGHGRERFVPLRDDEAVMVRDDAHEVVASSAVE